MTFLEALLFCVILFVSLIIGVFAYCQIIGTIRTFFTRPIWLEFSTIIIWVLILLACGFIMHKWLNDYKLAFYIANLVSIVLSWRTGKNGIE